MAKYERTIQMIHDLVEDQIVPGVSYSIFSGGVRVSEIFGEAQLKPTREKLWPGALYDVASLTKVIGTTTIILKLIQDGRLTAEDSIQQYLPEFGDSRVTIRHLMTHTSGISGYIKDRNHLPADELTRRLLALTVDDGFNQRVKYADVGFIYLGWIIEYFYHQPVQKVITDEVLKPLGMNESSFTPRPEQCVPTEIQTDRGLIKGQVHDPKAFILGEHCGCAGLFSSLTDVEKFAHAMIESNLIGILRPETLDQVFKDQTPMAGFHGRSLGWRVLKSHDAEQHLAIYHTGFTGTWMVLDRENDSGFILLSNRVHPTAQNPEFLSRRDILIETFLDENTN